MESLDNFQEFKCKLEAKIHNGGLFLDSSPFSLQKDACLKIGQNRLKNSHLAFLFYLNPCHNL